MCVSLLLTLPRERRGGGFERFRCDAVGGASVGGHANKPSVLAKRALRQRGHCRQQEGANMQVRVVCGSRSSPSPRSVMDKARPTGHGLAEMPRSPPVDDQSAGSERCERENDQYK
jgi:hypothetical protein